MDLAGRVKHTRMRKRLAENVLPDANELEASRKPVLDLERLRRLTEIARPLLARAESAPSRNATEGASVTKPDRSGQSRSPAGPHRRARADR